MYGVTKIYVYSNDAYENKYMCMCARVWVSEYYRNDKSSHAIYAHAHI